MFFVLLPHPERNLAGGNQAAQSTIRQVSREFHLNASLHEQYASYMWRVFAHQTAGSRRYASPDQDGVTDSGAVARQAIPPTLSLVILTLVISPAWAVSSASHSRGDPGGGSMAFRSTSRSG
jgi:ABC-type dipeptide/oligopeptide/nickel transport system permease component